MSTPVRVREDLLTPQQEAGHRKRTRAALDAAAPPAWLAEIPTGVLFSADVATWTTANGHPLPSLLDVEAERRRRSTRRRYRSPKGRR